MRMELILNIVAWTAIWIVISLVMTEVAGRIYGNKGLWIYFFLLLPVISIPGFFFIYWFSNKRRIEANAAIKIIRDGESSSKKSTGGTSVTPFESEGTGPVVSASLRINYAKDENPEKEILSENSYTGTSVTPFGYQPAGEEDEDIDADVEEISEDEFSNIAILAELHDKRIEELIEWEEWDKAYARAEEQLQSAQSVGDKRSIELYKAYLALLRPRILRL